MMSDDKVEIKKDESDDVLETRLQKMADLIDHCNHEGMDTDTTCSIIRITGEFAACISHLCREAATELDHLTNLNTLN